MKHSKRKSDMKSRHLRGNNMHARKAAALAIIAGLATATSLAGTAGSAFADTRSPAPSNTTASNGGAVSQQGNVKAPATKHDRKSNVTAAGKSADRNTAKDVNASAASYTNCYQTANYSGTLCNYWNYNRGGSRGGIYYADANWADNYYVTTGSGQWQRMANNNASAWNWDAYLTAKVYPYTSYYGAQGTIKPYVYGNYVSPWLLNTESSSWG